MDFEILPQLIIVISIAGILFIIGKNYSKVKQASDTEFHLMQATAETDKEKAKFIYLYKRAIRRINKENYQKTVAMFWLWFEKSLRKIRINFLKLDGKIVALLERLRKKNTASFEKLKETERTFRKNMENENFSKFWNAKKQEIKTKNNTTATSDTPEDDYDKMISPENVDTQASEIKAVPAEKSEAIAPYVVKTYSDTKHVNPERKKIVEEEGLIEEKSDSTARAEKLDISVADEVPKSMDKGVKKSLGDAKEENEEETNIRTKKEQEYIEILMKNPHDIKAYWKLGLIYSKRRNYEDSLACFRQIVKIDPTYTKAKQKAIELMEKMKKKGK